jgi:hypothetical protein
VWTVIAFLEEVTRKRWKGYSEFMFWGCFSYDHKGPCHIWKPETAAEKAQALEEIEAWNKAAESIYRDLFQAEHPGEIWVWNKESGKRERRAKKGGIDWVRYGKLILDQKLLPFAYKCKQDRPDTLVQEDGAPSYVHSAQQERYDLFGILKLLWPGNSPDLSAIEPAWPFLKRRTTCRGAWGGRAFMILKWKREWKRMPMKRIQKWIERIPRHTKDSGA